MQRENCKYGKQRIPKGKWVKCTNCGKAIYVKDLRENDFICPKCDQYFRMNAYDRLNSVLEEGSFEELHIEAYTDKNLVDFPGYKEKIIDYRKKTNLYDAILAGKGRIGKTTVMIGVCDSRFLMGSMGYVVGEKITRLFEIATQNNLPVIMFSCSGGARMQEGMISLMQMAKTSAAVKRHSDKGLLYISVLTDPTTGGVAASFAMLGDIILAEPGALIGFAGPRVIEQTINEKLPSNFQSAEFLLNNGLIDNVIERKVMKEYIEKILVCHMKPKIHKINKKEQVYFCASKLAKRSNWERVLISRSNERPTTMDYIESIFELFLEFHGDQMAEDDKSIIGGIAMINGIPVTVIGHQKGRNTKESIERNFGMAHPAGYRKALRLMKEAEKFGRPIITFIDTPGAACGVKAEEEGEATAIAKNIFEMSSLKVPILSILIGEGGSGGALGIAVANEVWGMENATYSILSPEGFASILWKDSKRAQEASAVMKMTADELLKQNIIEKIIPEMTIANRNNIAGIATCIKNEISQFVYRMRQIDEKNLIQMRYNRFRKF